VIATFQPTQTGEAYDWLGSDLLPYATAYAGFKCPGCGVGVYKAKRPRNLGQGRIAWITSCHCIVHLAPAQYGKLEPITPAEWQFFLKRKIEEEKGT
jgi:hypothetical protein